MQSIVSMGKNVKDAIETGLKLMDATKTDVNVEIIQVKKKGFFGIGGKRAIVKLSRDIKNALTNPSSNDHLSGYDIVERIVKDIPSNKEGNGNPTLNQTFIYDRTTNRYQDKGLSGKAWIKNGRIFVKDSETRYPTIVINNNIKLIKNNKAVKERTTIISENDKLEIAVADEHKETVWKISLCKHQLTVTLKVEPGYHLIRKIRNQEAQYQIELVADEYKEVVNTLDINDVMNELEELHVSYGIDQRAIEDATRTTEPGEFIIGRGKAPTKGKDGWVELHVEIDPKDGLVEDELGKVDFRELKTIPMVEHGKIIASIHPPMLGNPGRTVTNEVLPIKRSYPVIFRPEKGVMVIDNKVVATASGRPFVEKRGQLYKASVIPKLIHDGNVDLASGNIRFKGDVEIKGAVQENMLVEAGGDIVVFKTINHSSITTSKSIVTYGNVIGSHLSAGKNNMLIVELGSLLGSIQVKVEKMIALINQLITTPSYISSEFSQHGLQPLITLLLEKKFHGLRKLIKQYVEVSTQGREYLEDSTWLQVSVSLNQIFLSISNQTITLSQIINLSKKMEELFKFSQTPIEPNSYITISDALNSSLYSSGNIILIGKGSINTKIHSGGLLKISGVARGGELFGKLGVDVNEVGSNSGTQTKISVPSDQTIKIGKVMEGTIIKIGHQIHVFRSTQFQINAHLDKDEKIIFD